MELYTSRQRSVPLDIGCGSQEAHIEAKIVKTFDEVVRVHEVAVLDLSISLENVVVHVASDLRPLLTRNDGSSILSERSDGSNKLIVNFSVNSSVHLIGSHVEEIEHVGVLVCVNRSPSLLIVHSSDLVDDLIELLELIGPERPLLLSSGQNSFNSRLVEIDLVCPSEILSNAVSNRLSGRSVTSNHGVDSLIVVGTEPLRTNQTSDPRLENITSEVSLTRDRNGHVLDKGRVSQKHQSIQYLCLQPRQ